MNPSPWSVAGALQTCFGPLGRSKVLKSAVGAVVLTRDGSLLLEHVLSRSRSRVEGDELGRLSLQVCMGVSERFGDGGLQTLLVLEHLQRVCAEVGEEKRARLVLALEAVSSTMKHLEQDVVLAMTEGNHWRQIDDVKWIRALWMTALVPALNATSARALEGLMSNSWIGGTLSGKRGLNSLYKRCKYVLSNFDLMVLPATRETQSLSDSFCTEADELFIEGNARDHTALSHSAPRKFVCIAQVLQSHDESTTMTAQVTVKVASLLELTANPSGRLTQTRVLANALVSRGISLIFCSDRVQEAELFELASRGICVTDCVPVSHLKRLATLSGTTCWLSAAEIVSGISSSKAACGTLKSIKLVCLRGTDTHLRLQTLAPLRRENDGEDEEEKRERDNDPIATSQLVFFCSSSSTSSIYTRMLKRCLVIACSALEGTDAEGNGAGCVIPGAGAGEMGWSSLWTGVAQELHSAGSSKSQGYVQLTATIAERIGQHLQRFVGSSGPALTLLLMQSEQVCTAVADAYRQPPRMLLAATLPATSDVNRALLLWPLDGGWVSSPGDAASLASFKDPFNVGIVTSARAFLYAFTAIIESALCLARLGPGQPLLFHRKKNLASSASLN